MQGLYALMDWVSRFVYLSVLWLAFSIMGLGVAGIFPATSAMFTITRKWAIGETDIGMTRLFVRSYFRDFWRTNLLGYMLAIVGVILYADLRFIGLNHSGLLDILFWIIAGITFIYLVVIVYIFPAFVHMQANTLNYVRTSLSLAVLQPIKTILLVIISVFAILMLRGIVPFLLISVWSYIIMKVTLQGFAKLEKRTGLPLTVRREVLPSEAPDREKRSRF